jgi:endonuclease/exonuclease/phosphatase family metal-dependent hydrolase
MTYKELGVATYNIEFGKNAEKIIHNIEKLTQDGADIICLQEIINNEIVANILKKLGSQWQAAYHVGEENSRLAIGTCIIWHAKKCELIKEEKFLLPKLKEFALHEKFYYWVMGVQSIPIQRKAITCYFTINNKMLRVTSLHIDNVGGPMQRMKQLHYLLSQLKQLEPPDYELICGDFNTFDLIRTGYEKSLLHRELGKEFTDASKGIAWTSDIYYTDFSNSIELFHWLVKTCNIHIRRKLDYIWSKNLKRLACSKKIFYGSDHFPIIAKLEL